MNKYINSGREAIRLLYFLIIGLGITSAIKELFIVNGIFGFPNYEKITLFFIYFSFILRFFLGAYRVLAYDIEVEKRRKKIVIDMYGFFIQALIFYLFSISYFNFHFTQWLIIVLCIIDLIWLLILLFIYKILNQTSIQWLIHNVVILIVLPLNIYYWDSIPILILISVIAFLSDIILNNEFYFSSVESSILKIMVLDFGYKVRDRVESIEILGKLNDAILEKGHIPVIHFDFLEKELGESDIRLALHKNYDAVYVISQDLCPDNFVTIAKKNNTKVFYKIDSIPELNTKNNSMF